MKITPNIFLVLCFCALSQMANAQSNSMLRRQGIVAERDKDWYSAAQYYQRLYFSDTANLKLKYAFAETSRKAYDNEVSLRLYMQIAAVDNGRRFPMALYWSGQGLKTKGDYKQAKLWFGKFYKLKKSDEELKYYKMRAKQEIEYCENAQILLKYPVNIKLEQVPSGVNSKASEYAPYEFDSTLYFSSIRFPERRDPRLGGIDVYSKIYRSNIRKGRYMKTFALDTVINANRLHNANLCYSPSGDFMVMSRCVALNHSDFRCDLYNSRLVSKRWQVPYKMREPLNIEGYSSTQPHLAIVDTQLVLFFSSDRPGGEGGLDIWYAMGTRDGIFSSPVNAGKNINTPEDEVTPWFVTEERTLYFSSSYHGGLGGQDIFKSVFGSDGFSEPVNAGFPLNSGYNDLYYSVNENSRRAYLSSNRPGSFSDNKNNCCTDIYMYSYDTVITPPAIDTATIQKEKLRLLVPLTLFFHNDRPDPKTTNTVTSITYDSTFRNYMAMLSQYETEFSAGLRKEEEQLAKDMISNFFADSVQNGMEGLERFTTLMLPLLERGETIKITMKGYCSPLASTNYNQNLAKRRISSLRNYFRTTRDGVLLKYIEGEEKGKIIFEDVDIGELKATRASDSFRDRRNSVFSPFAAAERKIQIIAVSFGEAE